MRLEFNYTFDDYREALQAHTKKFRPKSRLGKWLFGSVAVAVVGLMIFSKQATRNAPSPPPTSAADSPLLPLLLWVAAVVFAVIVMRVQWTAKGSRRSQIIHRAILLNALTAAVSVVVFALVPVPAAHEESDSTLSSIHAMVRSFAPWIVCGGYIGLMLRFGIIDAHRRAWEGQPALHQPETLQITEESITLSNALMASTHQWFAFQQFSETANLFVLHIGAMSFMMIPKRAFADAAAMEWFRMLVQEKIARQTKAFPVLPAIPVQTTAPAAESSK